MPVPGAETGADHATVYALGFSYWKRRPVRRFLAGARVIFVDRAERVQPGATLAVWGQRPIPGRVAPGVRLLRLEDGFLRSVGLGADLIHPVSWVIDGRGLYYDATRPSDLEVILATTDFPVSLLARARALRESVVAAGLTKYNVGSAPWHRPSGAGRVILVPGQVETDASLAYGAPGVRTNMGLLAAVRAAHPGAYLIYKPHPDVLARLRAPGVDEARALEWADEQVTEVAMGTLLPLVDEVHVLTSLTGFEALLRAKPVTCYGQPFYAGWGLTTDICPVGRRSRRLTLDQLVAAVLILYPRYVQSQDRRPHHAGAGARRPAGLACPGRCPRALVAQGAAYHPEAGGGRAMTQRRSYLFLQGLATPFFTRLADRLRADGHAVHRVNFCAGDAAYWGTRPAWNFRRGLPGLADFLASRILSHAVSDLILFGDLRPIHRQAIAVAKSQGLRVHCFEEGYVRPNWITCERGGVNGHSSLPRDPEWYQAVNAALPDYGDGRSVRVPLPVRAAQDLAYRMANTLNVVTYPRYRTHRPKHAALEYLGWMRRFAQLPLRGRDEQRLMTDLLGRQRPLFVLPLQLSGDAQIVHHSPFAHMDQVIELVLTSFARHAPSAAEILIKNHPLDTGLVPYRRTIGALAQGLGLTGRVHYVETGHLPTLFEHAAGVVVVNSTVGLSALHQGRPTKALARPIYDLPGLTSTAPLDAFWTDHQPPDAALFRAFRNTVIHATQVNGDFFTREGIALAVEGCMRMLAERSPLEALFGSFGRPLSGH